MRYGIGFRSSGPTLFSGGTVAIDPLFTILAPATSSVKIMEVAQTGNFIGSATSASVWFSRPTTPGVGPQATYTPQPEEDDGAPPALTRIVTQWATAPIVPSSGSTTPSYRRFNMDTATSRTNCIWSFPRGLALPAGQQMCLYVMGTGGAVLILSVFHVVVDE